MLNVNEVYTFKMASSEEIIAKVVSYTGTEGKIKISDPLSIAPNKNGMGLIPSMFSADPNGEFELNINSVAIIANTDENIKMKYIEATTGLTLPDKKLILG